MLDGSSVDSHHLIPKTFGGRCAEPLHRVCHTKLHHTFSEKEMRDYYHTWERLQEHDEVKKFIRWVAKKEPDFITGHRDTKSRKRKRR